MLKKLKRDNEMINLLYIHGFNSSPGSMKVQLSEQYLTKHYSKISFYCPQLFGSPNNAIAQLENILSLKPNENWLLIGSSLGGYFATYLSEKYQYPAVLINPAVKPYELFNDYLGEQENPYTGEVFQVEKHFLNELKLFENKKISKKNYLVMVQKGDEVLDYQQAVEKYQYCQLVVQEGGDHSFIDYETMLPKIDVFFDL